jgi:predicted anti-sigma-YlaC factor YlaD
MATRTTCEQVVGEVSRYLEGRLPAHLQARVEGHLQHCERCAVVVGTTQKLLAIVADERVFATPFDGTNGWCERLLDNLRNLEKQKSFPSCERFPC